MPDLNLDEIKRRWEKTTKGDWRLRRTLNINDNDCFVEARQVGKPYGREILSDETYSTKEADADFIVHARNDDIPALIAEVERLRKERIDLMLKERDETKNHVFISLDELKKVYDFYYGARVSEEKIRALKSKTEKRG